MFHYVRLSFRCGEFYLSGRANQLISLLGATDSEPWLVDQRFTGRHPAPQQSNNAFQSAKMGLPGVIGKHIRMSVGISSTSRCDRTVSMLSRMLIKTRLERVFAFQNLLGKFIWLNACLVSRMYAVRFRD